MKRTSHSYFVLMIDYGKPYVGKTGPSGFQAVADPEFTRRDIVDQVRDILRKGRNEIAFIHFVDGLFVEDVTSDLLAEAEQREDA